ncbi:hypothetical protein FFT09_06970 [Saccharomonospora piscinae]|uniref:YunG family protein n=1 Tax=Saccharomonospora piscinae TaxID=687388 RepID=UPI00110753EB|nr:hypothetical protein [Saccharomonospora piscinae]TLW93159.1 hypothetical protein FFT09_06970 [Saccharomonospora piscinae]
MVALETALRDCWDEQTCDPAVTWNPDNPAAGHCGVTSMALTELLGGVLLCAGVTLRDGTPNGMHYWNRLDNGLEIDITRDQFRDGEKLGHPSTETPRRLPTARMATRYDLYAARVRDRLGCYVPRGISGHDTQSGTSRPRTPLDGSLSCLTPGGDTTFTP